MSLPRKHIFTLMKRVAASLATVVLVALLAVLSLHQDGELRTDIWINRPPHAVWKVLTTTADYPAWNPEITRMDGQLSAGKVIELTSGSGTEALTFHPLILAVHTDQDIRWKGHVWLPGIFDAEHSFVLEGHGNQTHFIQSEKFTGLFVGRLTQDILQQTAIRMQAMNRALKIRTEAST